MEELTRLGLFLVATTDACVTSNFQQVASPAAPRLRPSSGCRSLKTSTSSLLPPAADTPEESVTGASRDTLSESPPSCVIDVPPDAAVEPRQGLYALQPAGPARVSLPRTLGPTGLGCREAGGD